MKNKRVEIQAVCNDCFFYNTKKQVMKVIYE